MDKTTLINLAAKSKMLKNLANKLCNYRYISDDLFQEFLLYLCNKPEDFLVKKYLEVQFIFYCTNVIRGLNSHRLKANTLINTRNPLSEKQTLNELSGFEFQTEEYNFELDAKIETVKQIAGDDFFTYYSKPCTVIAKELNTTKRIIRYKKNKQINELKRYITTA